MLSYFLILLKKSYRTPGFSVSKSNFFLLTPSPWPIFSSFAAFVMLTGFAAYMNYYEGGLFLFFFGLLLVILAFFFWCRDLVSEMTFLGRFSMLIKYNSSLGFWLFMLSEALLFLSFFWAFFHASLEPGMQVGIIWPPYESIQMNSLIMPMLNTAFLLLSGAAVTWVQYGMIAGLSSEVFNGFLALFFYSMLFTLSQVNEYIVAFHQVNDAVFGSSMYILTAFHGGHVIMGTIFLLVCFMRFELGHFKTTSYLGLTLAAWYWHFVDVVWVLVFLWVYLWGSWVPYYFLESFVENLFNM